MTALISTLRADGLRYMRSPWVWLLMIAGPVFARVWIPGEGDSTSVIVVNDAAPVLTSSTLGISLGVVVSALLLPLAYIFLRAGPTRRQPWQVQDVSATPHSQIALGHWLADISLFATLLAGLSLAGCILGYVMLPARAVSPIEIIFTLWLTAFPALALMAGVRSFFASIRFTRGGWGDFGFFIFWMTGLVLGGILVSEGQASAFFDYSGAFTPIMANVSGTDANIGIGASAVDGKTIALNVLTPMLSAEYLSARLFWFLMGASLSWLGAQLYQSPLPKVQRKPRWYARYFGRTAKPKPVDRNAPPAFAARLPTLSAMVASAKLILRSRAGIILAIMIACAGIVLPFRSIISPAALLLLILGSTAHAARVEARGMRLLLATQAISPWARRAIDGVVIVLLSLGMALPAQLVGDWTVHGPLGLALATGIVVATISVLLGALTRSAFAPRMLLLIAWYGYISV
jgi:hypothetical protein